jgi:prepilin-type processing-associated H-X9-DG protein
LAFLPLADYGDLSQVFHCPSDPLLEGHRGGIRRSYVMSKGKPDQESISRGMSGDGWSTALHEVPVPSRVILSLEFDYDSNRVGKTRYASLENVFVQEMGDALGLHVMGSMVFNYLFVDGSVKDLYYGETLSQDPDALGHSGYMTIDPSDDPR